MKLDWKQIVIAFVLGVFLGVLGTVRCLPFGFHSHWGNPKEFHRHLMQEFTSKLKLTSDQREKVSVILENTRAKVNALREEVHPKFQEIRNSSRIEIRKILTPDQQKKFDAMSAEMDARFEKHR